MSDLIVQELYVLIEELKERVNSLESQSGNNVTPFDPSDLLKRLKNIEEWKALLEEYGLTSENVKRIIALVHMMGLSEKALVSLSDVSWKAKYWKGFGPWLFATDPGIPFEYYETLNGNDVEKIAYILPHKEYLSTLKYDSDRAVYKLSDSHNNLSMDLYPSRYLFQANDELKSMHTKLSDVSVKIGPCKLKMDMNSRMVEAFGPESLVVLIYDVKGKSLSQYLYRAQLNEEKRQLDVYKEGWKEIDYDRFKSIMRQAPAAKLFMVYTEELLFDFLGSYIKNQFRSVLIGNIDRLITEVDKYGTIAESTQYMLLYSTGYANSISGKVVELRDVTYDIKVENINIPAVCQNTFMCTDVVDVSKIDSGLIKVKGDQFVVHANAVGFKQDTSERCPIAAGGTESIPLTLDIVYDQTFQASIDPDVDDKSRVIFKRNDDLTIASGYQQVGFVTRIIDAKEVGDVPLYARIVVNEVLKFSPYTSVRTAYIEYRPKTNLVTQNFNSVDAEHVIWGLGAKNNTDTEDRRITNQNQLEDVKFRQVTISDARLNLSDYYAEGKEIVGMVANYDKGKNVTLELRFEAAGSLSTDTKFVTKVTIDGVEYEVEFSMIHDETFDKFQFGYYGKLELPASHQVNLLIGSSVKLEKYSDEDIKKKKAWIPTLNSKGRIQLSQLDINPNLAYNPTNGLTQFGKFDPINHFDVTYRWTNGSDMDTFWCWDTDDGEISYIVGLEGRVVDGTTGSAKISRINHAGWENMITPAKLNKLEGDKWIIFNNLTGGIENGYYIHGFDVITYEVMIKVDKVDSLNDIPYGALSFTGTVKELVLPDGQKIINDAATFEMSILNYMKSLGIAMDMATWRIEYVEKRLDALEKTVTLIIDTLDKMMEAQKEEVWEGLLTLTAELLAPITMGGSILLMVGVQVLDVAFQAQRHDLGPMEVTEAVINIGLAILSIGIPYFKSLKERYFNGQVEGEGVEKIKTEQDGIKVRKSVKQFKSKNKEFSEQAEAIGINEQDIFGEMNSPNFKDEQFIKDVDVEIISRDEVCPKLEIDANLNITEGVIERDFTTQTTWKEGDDTISIGSSVRIDEKYADGKMTADQWLEYYDIKYNNGTKKVHVDKGKIENDEGYERWKRHIAANPDVDPSLDNYKLVLQRYHDLRESELYLKCKKRMGFPSREISTLYRASCYKKSSSTMKSQGVSDWCGFLHVNEVTWTNAS